jgi:C4-dicarboxylate-specific signal transduction histidine kinase
MNNFQGKRKSHRRQSASDTPWRIYLMVIIAGITVTAIVGYGFYKGDRMTTVDARMANAAMQAKLEAMISNIVLEETLSHGIVSDPADIWQRVEGTLRNLKAQRAAQGTYRSFLLSSAEAAILQELQNIESKLHDLKALTKDRFSKNEVSLLQRELDKQYKILFTDFMATLDRLEDGSRHIMQQNITRFRYTQAVMIFICISLSLLIGITFHRYERGRATAYSAIEKANQDLNTTVADLKQTQEALQKARKDLEKKVAARTRELAGANQNLRAEISERKHVEQQLQQNMIMLQAIFDGISDNLILVNKNMGIKLINKAAGKYYGISSSRDVVGRRCYQMAGRPGPCDDCALPTAILEKKTITFERKGLMNPDKFEQVVVYPLVEKEFNTEDAIIRISDITEKKLFERKIRQSEKMASIGILVSAIAHEINNPNNFISFNIPILKEYLEELIPIIDEFVGNDQRREFFQMPYDEFRQDLFKILDNIGHGSERISAFVANLKEFTYSDKNRIDKWIDLSAVIQKAIALCKNKVRNNVKTLSVEIPPNIPPILSDPHALQHILINLLLNAAQAANKEDAWIKLSVSSGQTPSDHIIIEVSDNGCGMDEKTRQHLFDPFFTTKSIGEGTGLGLYVCYTLIGELGGRIDVDSEPGQGSTFKVILQKKDPQTEKLKGIEG